MRITNRRFIKTGDSVLMTEAEIGAAVERGSGAQAFRAQLIVPEQRQLYDYWLEMAGTHSIPRRADINPVRMPRLLPGISLIEVDADITKCRVRLAGTKLREIFDREVTGMLVTDLPHANKFEYWQAAYHRTIELAQPTQGVVRGPIVNKEHVVQYWLKLPLRTATEAVGMVLCYDHFLPASEIMQEHESRIPVAS